MKKCFYLFIISLFSFFIFDSMKIDAKTSSVNEVSISFGKEDMLNLNYLEGSSFKIREDNNGYYFYYNGLRHTLNSSFTLLDNEIVIDGYSFTLEGENLTIDTVNMLVLSESNHEFYAFAVDIDFSSIGNTYLFSQKLCYKYNQIESCNEDTDDAKEIDRDVGYNFYYDFLPFYSDQIKFDYLKYSFTISKDNITYNLEDITFTKDEINYNEYFLIGGYGNVSEGEDNNYYIAPFTYANDPNSLYIRAYFLPGYTVNEQRQYRVKFYSCVGKQYLECEEIYSSDNQTTLSYQIYNVPISNIIYNNETKELNYNSFKLKGSYVCIEECSNYSRAENEITYTNEEIYYLNLSNPVFEGEINGKAIGCGFYTCYGVSGEISNKVLFSDHNGISKVYYYLSNTRLTSIEEINIEIDNDSTLTIGEGLDGYYYLYYKVIDKSGIKSSNLNSPYIYLFDNIGPSLESSNFDSYSSDGIYNEVSINVNFVDNWFNSAHKIFYKVVKESDYSNINKEQLINANEYSNNVNIQDFIDSDGVYRVCFIGQDYLQNYGDIVCSNKYYLDITKLDKSEVSISEGNSSYLTKVNIHIDITQISEGVSFKCGLILNTVKITSSNELKSVCYNKKDNLLTGENGEYKLWIYASDVVLNFALIEFDEIYLLDNVSPTVSYLIEGNNQEYSNNVSISLEFEDLNSINNDSIEYVFYQNDYSNLTFNKFSLNEKIIYPYNYYGEYKLAVKVCDVIENCTTYTDETKFLIDTGIINLKLIGEKSITILRWGKYKELGAKADKGNKAISYRIESDLDTSKSGIYYIEYISGEGMNRVSITRQVIVKDSTLHIVMFIGIFSLGVIIISLRLFVKIRKNDTI